MKKQFLLLLVLAVLCFLLIPAKAQESDGDGNGRGVVRFADPDRYCSDGFCPPIGALLTPVLFDIDPATGALLGADRSDKAIAQVVPPDLPASVVTLKLVDRVWSDGQPVTAYDLLLSLMLAQQSTQAQAMPESVVGARIDDEHTITLRFTETEAEIAELPPDQPPRAATCDALPRMNLYLLPFRALIPTFDAFVEQDAPAGDIPSLDAWWDAYNHAAQRYPAIRSGEAITSGAYRVAGSGQFVPVDGTGAALQSRVNLPDAVDAFIAGDTNVLLDVPVSERPGLRLLADPNRRNLQISEVPGRESLIILLNFGDPGRPLPGIHPETGELVDQGKNPLFSDPALRRALQLAINTPALIDGVMQRSAVVLAGLFPPSSWAFDATLTRVETNLQEARRLLDEAGWKENGVVRVCAGCATAPEGTQLQFALGSSSEDYPLADEITKQWAQIGVSSFVSGEGSFLLASQSFDAYLARIGGRDYEDADPDRTLMLTPAGDVLTQIDVPDGRTFLNYGSYSNPEVTDLLQQARTLPGCDPAGRAAIYHQLERVLQQDLPFLSVAAPNEFYAAAPNVLGFAPRTGKPLWNVESWVVAS